MLGACWRGDGVAKLWRDSSLVHGELNLNPTRLRNQKIISVLVGVPDGRTVIFIPHVRPLAFWRCHELVENFFGRLMELDIKPVQLWHFPVLIRGIDDFRAVVLQRREKIGFNGLHRFWLGAGGVDSDEYFFHGTTNPLKLQELIKIQPQFLPIFRG